MKKIFFIDYDNTIFSHRTLSIPKSAAEALLNLQCSGHKVFLASGRGLNTNLLPALPEGFSPDGLVGANGAVVEVEGEVLWKRPMDAEQKKRLMNFAQEKGYLILTYCDGLLYVSDRKRYLDSHFKDMEIPPMKADDEFNELHSKEVFSFFMQESLDILNETQRHFPDLKLLYMGEITGGADVIPAENGKLMGIRRVLSHYHADLKDAVAIGDSMNDLEMIQNVGLGIAMGNAMPEVQKAAVYTAKDIDDGGLADAVQYALAQEKLTS